MNMLLLYTHSHIGILTINAYTRSIPSAVKWIVGHFVALWEILSVEPVVQLHPFFFFFHFIFITRFPLPASFICQLNMLAPPHPQSPLTSPLPQLHRTTHYLQEDNLKSKSPFFSSLSFCLLNAKDFSLLCFTLVFFFPHPFRWRSDGEEKKGDSVEISPSSRVFQTGAAPLLGFYYWSCSLVSLCVHLCCVACDLFLVTKPRHIWGAPQMWLGNTCWRMTGVLNTNCFAITINFQIMSSVQHLWM